MTLGRHGTDITIEDPKISSKHARLELRPGKGFWLMDMGSSNAIRTGDGKRVFEMKLEPDVVFRLGRTRFKVSVRENKTDSTQPEIVVENSITPTETWRVGVRSIVERGVREAKSVTPKEFAPFNSCLHMKITRGPQTGTEWTLGYGPRSVGAASVDLPFDEPGLPGVCMKLHPHQDGVLLRTTEDARGLIQINGKKVDVAILKNHDVIEIGHTRIEVKLDRAPRKST
jgi:pSer/pThr/pTyr-binding forkhead associated (FHA) protein